MRLFVSYAHRDEPLVKRLVRLLEESGHDVWWDKKLLPGTNWLEELRTKIHHQDVLVYMLTPESVKSENCQWELATALAASKRILPILLKETTLPQVFSERQYVDLRDGITAQALASINAGLNHMLVSIPSSSVPMPPSPTMIQTSPIGRNLGLTALAIGITSVALVGITILALNNRPSNSCSGNSFSGNNGVYVLCADGNVEINTGAPLDAQAEQAVTEIFGVVRNIELSLPLLQNFLTEFTQVTPLEATSEMVRATVAPALNTVIGSAYDQLTLQSTIDSLQVALDSYPITKEAHPLTEQLFTNIDASSKYLQDFYNQASALSYDYQQLLDWLRDNVDETENTAWRAALEQRVESQVNIIFIDSVIASLYAQQIFADITSAYPQTDMSVDELMLFDNRLLTPQEIQRKLTDMIDLRADLTIEGTNLVATLEASAGDDIATQAREIEEMLTINPDDTYNEVIGKAISLRQFGRIDDSVAAFKRYGEMFASTDPTAPLYTQIAVKFTQQIANLQVTNGIYLWLIEEGSTAMTAGLQVGDIITLLNETAYANPQELSTAIQGYPIGTNLEFTVLRYDSQTDKFTRISIRLQRTERLGIGMSNI